VADPLAGDEDRHDVVELEFHHLERRRVAVAGEVADQAAILVHLLGARPVGDAGGLDDREVGGLARRGEAGHDVHQRDQPVLVDLHLPPGRAAHHVVHLPLERLALDRDVLNRLERIIPGRLAAHGRA
jgi:hypothetical protein